MEYKKKPVIINATKWHGISIPDEQPDWFNDALNDGKLIMDGTKCLHIVTLEGTMKAKPGDYIVKGIAGELYPYRPDIFKATHEVVTEDNRYKY